MAPADGGGHEILESIHVPNLPNAPFSLTLATEWSRPLANGGTFTVVNARPIKRDSAGRLYQERWGMVPKGSHIASTMLAIQIEDPVGHTFTQCTTGDRLCVVVTLAKPDLAHYDPGHLQSGPLKDGNGTYTHEDLGAQTFAGLPVHGYRDTTTLNAGVFGNDLPMSTVREVRYCAELGFNLSSTLEAPQIGRQVFTVTDLSVSEPNPQVFQTPSEYRIVDRRKTAAAVP